MIADESFPLLITKETLPRIRKVILSAKPVVSYYVRLKYRLTALFLLTASCLLSRRFFSLFPFFFLIDYLLYRGHRNYKSRQDLKVLELFIEKAHLKKLYEDHISNVVSIENLKGNFLSYNLVRKIKIDAFIMRYNQQNATLLDIACSDGGMTYDFTTLPNYNKLFGIDLNISRLRVYRERHGGGQIPVAGDVERLPFKDNSFDIVFGTDILEHLFRPDQMLLEIHRVLRTGGYLYISTNNAHYISFASAFNPLIVFERLLGLHWQKALGVTNFIYGKRKEKQYYHKDFPKLQLLKLIQSSGFEVKEIKTFNFFWDIFYPLGKRMRRPLFVKFYLTLQALLERLPVFKYAGEHGIYC